MIRRISIIVFGALPATYLSLFAALAVVMGTSALVNEPLSGLLLLAWGSVGILGTISLWAAAFVRTGRVTGVGLVAGCVAIAPLAYAYLGRLGFRELMAGSPELLIAIYITVGPLATGIAILLSALRRNITAADPSGGHMAGNEQGGRYAFRTSRRRRLANEPTDSAASSSHNARSGKGGSLASALGLLTDHAHRAFADEEDTQAVEKEVEQRELSEKDRTTHEESNANNYYAPEDILHDAPRERNL